MTPPVSPLLINHQPVALSEDNVIQIVAAMDIPNTTRETQFTLERKSAILRHKRVKVIPNTVAIAYYRGVVVALAAVDAVLYIHALGGQYQTRSLRPHRAEHIIVRGVDQRCSFTVRAGTAFCGPIWCAPKRRDDLLATLPWLGMRGGLKWCSPIDNYGVLRCAACHQPFSTAAQLFAHGGIPSRQIEHFNGSEFLIPPNFSPLPKAVEVAPVPADNLSEGSLVDNRRTTSVHRHTHGQNRVASLRQRLHGLRRQHGDRYVPYVLRRVYR